MAQTISIIQTTLPGDWAEPVVGEWASSFVQEGLAACVQRSRVTSVYRWEGSLESTEEWRIQLKTSRRTKDKLFDSILANHPFENPQVVSWEAEATPDYASWVEG